MGKKDKYENSGQITLEASIVVPLIIMIVAFFIYMALYIHDELNSYRIKISYAANGNRNFINRIIGEKETDTISIQKTMPREILYSKAATINKSKRKD